VNLSQPSGCVAYTPLFLSSPDLLTLDLISILSHISQRILNTMTWIRQYDLPALREYKYSGVDHSLVSRYIMKPFYSNVVIHLFPLNMA
jgi:hypothetical protein